MSDFLGGILHQRTSDALNRLALVLFSLLVLFLISAAKVRSKCAGFLRRKEKVSEKCISETSYGEMTVCFHQSFLCFDFLVYVFFDLCT